MFLLSEPIPNGIRTTGKIPKHGRALYQHDGGIISGMDRRLVRNDTGGERARSLGITRLTPAVGAGRTARQDGINCARSREFR